LEIRLSPVPSTLMVYSWSQVESFSCRCRMSRLPSAEKYASAFCPPNVIWVSLLKNFSVASGARAFPCAGAGRLAPALNAAKAVTAMTMRAVVCMSPLVNWKT